MFALAVILRRPHPSVRRDANENDFCVQKKMRKEKNERKKEGGKCARAAADRRVDHSPRIIYPPAYWSLWFVGSAAVKNVLVFFLPLPGRCLPLIDFSSFAAESLADAPYNSTVLGYPDRLKPLESPSVDLPQGSAVVAVVAVVVEAVVVGGVVQPLNI